MRFRFERERRGFLFRWFDRHCERAWVSFRWCGLQFEIETPSDWHEEKLVWLHVQLIVLSLGLSLPWHGNVVPDNMHCSGPRYGFQFYEDLFWLHYGKDKSWSLYMPWHWRHRKHTEYPETKADMPYRYVLRSGEVQERIASIQAEERLWTRCWIPWRLVRKTIDVRFNDEVGEGTGSWKGGTVGCGYDMKPNEDPKDCLRRMEREREFSR